jgi:hypothetical protein
MGTVDVQLASELSATLGLRRAVETGTYRGRTARRLAKVFPAVTTIELSEELHSAAVESLRDVPGIDARQGHSVDVLRAITEPDVPTFYYLDGHWSGFSTAGSEDECPVIEEIEVIAAGHPDDCILIDDAPLFAASPLPPYDTDKWPTLLEVFDAVRAGRPEHHVTVIADQVIAVPMRARRIVDGYAHRARKEGETVFDRAKGVAFLARERLARR